MTLKQKVLLGLAGLTALAVGAGSVGTMAWFYSNTTVTASGLSMSVKGPATLKLSKDGTTWKAASDFSFSVTATLSPCVAFVYFSSDDHNVCSWSAPTCHQTVGVADTAGTKDAQMFFFVPTSGNPILSNGSVSKTIVESSSQNASYWSSIGTSAYSGYVIKETFYAKLDGQTYSSLTAKINPTFTCASTSSLTRAFRMIVGNISKVNYDHIDRVPVWNGSNSWGTNGEQKTRFSLGSSTTPYPITFYIWLDGGDSNCTTGNVSSSSYTATITLSDATVS